MSPESSLNLQGGRFQKGRSGNPKGKPKGARNRTTLLAESLLEGEAEALIRKAVQLALEGDQLCLRICLERIAPVKKDAPIRVELPDVAAVADIPKLLSAITTSIREGAITPSETGALIGLTNVFRKSLETVELETRIAVLEKNFKR